LSKYVEENCIKYFEIDIIIFKNFATISKCPPIGPHNKRRRETATQSRPLRRFGLCAENELNMDRLRPLAKTVTETFFVGLFAYRLKRTAPSRLATVITGRYSSCPSLNISSSVWGNHVFSKYSRSCPTPCNCYTDQTMLAIEILDHTLNFTIPQPNLVSESSYEPPSLLGDVTKYASQIT